ncbi:MAG: hypothetical protein AN484_06990 [Aphanizomenon flos-aquae WA102]|uniref:Uncharacterized protein n=1 Tax=Aphanizomenon flos-aquae WA102 TaxID=1710896 RepID=A0A1B7X546_APHFL|nr:MAG: hypothetical protein AN484_06990 [Aphanizomenon flos-aquae WA102]
MSELSLTESFAAMSPENMAALKDEVTTMSRDFSTYQVDFTTDLLPLSDIIIAMDNVAALGMQAPIAENKVQSILFDTTTGFLTSGILQQPIYIAVWDGVLYGVSGRHRSAALKTLMGYGLSPDTMIQVIMFKPSSMAIAMSMVMTSNGSRSVTKGESNGFRLARYGVLPEVNDCIRAGRDGTLSQSDAFANAAWFSYHEQAIGSRNNSTIQSIAKSFYTQCKKLNFSYEDTVKLLDDCLFNIEEASALCGRTDVARGGATIAENIVEILQLQPKEKATKKQAKRSVSATLFTRNL